MTCFPALIAAGLLVAPAAGGAAAPSAGVVTLRGKDVGRSIVVRPGQEVRILLSVGGAGWNWVARPDPAYRLLAPIAVEADPEHRSRQAAVVRIAFHTPGKTTVELAVVPNGGGGGGAANTLKYRFDVIG